MATAFLVGYESHTARDSVSGRCVVWEDPRPTLVLHECSCGDAFARSARGNSHSMRLRNIDARGTSGYAAPAFPEGLTMLDRFFDEAGSSAPLTDLALIGAEPIRCAFQVTTGSLCFPNA